MNTPSEYGPQFDGLNLDKQDPSIQEAIKKHAELKAAAIADAKKRMHLYAMLAENPGFELFLSDMDKAMEGALSDMEKSDNPTVTARATGAYCALKRLKTHCQDQVNALSTFLAEQGALTNHK